MDLRELRYFVTVADERHFGRAAARLHMTQPPLSRAIRQLEKDLGATLLERSPQGVTLSAAGAVLYDEARTLLEQAGHVRARVAATAGTATLTVGTLVDSAEQAGPELIAAFRERHPGVGVRVRETDLADPTAGLRAGLVDVALTRAPFEDDGISLYVLREDPVSVVLRADDPLAGRDTLRLGDLAGRRWFRLPEDIDPVWRAYWTGDPPRGEFGDGPAMRTIQECLQAVQWNGTVALAPLPLPRAFPEGLTTVRLTDMPPSPLVVAWNRADPNPLIRSFTYVAAGIYGPPASRREPVSAREPGVSPPPS